MAEKNSEKLLYQIKTLEKIIGRLFLNPDLGVSEVLLTPTQIQIIEYMINHENVYQRDLETILNLRRATVCGVLQTMEKNHFIKRVIDSKDLRVKKIILTNQAKEIYTSLEQKIANIEAIIKKDLTAEEINEFIGIIHKIQHNIQLVTGKEELKNDQVN